MRVHHVIAAVIVAAFVFPAAGAAQTPSPQGSSLGPLSPFLRGVPTGTPSDQPLALSLTDAVKRGLERNLGIILEQERLHASSGSRREDLAALLPHVSAGVRQSDQKVNLAAFGFTGFPGIPQVIGPFGVFDARLAVSAPIFDAEALGDLRESRARERAETHTVNQTREIVALVVSNLYLEAISDAARVDTARAEVTSAEALATLAEDRRTAGVAAGIDVLRQQVQLQSARARLIAAENTLAKQKLTLARAIGLPADQAFDLTDRITYTPVSAPSIDAAVDQATATRDDLRSAEAMVEAARAARQAAVGSRLPSVHVDADVGAIGASASTTTQTFTLAASVHVPIFEGGSARAKIQQADADLRSREAELADLKAGVRYDVQAAVLDLKAADASVAVAQSAETLARQQLDQAQDRFRAGVASTIELVQAEQSVATASEQYIASVHAHALALAGLARALGQVEARLGELVGGQR